MKSSDILLDGFVPQETDTGDLKIVILRYLKFWYLYLIGLVSFVGLAFLYFQYSVPEYPVSATILINATTNSSEFSQNAVYSDLENYQTVKTVENESQILSSFSLMNLVMKELDFRVSVFKKDNFFRRREVYGGQMPLYVELINYDSLSFFQEDLSVDFEFKLINTDQFELIDENDNAEKFTFGEEIIMPFGSFTVTRGEFFDPTDELSIVFNNPYSIAWRYVGKLEVFVVNKLASILNVSLKDPVPQKGILVLNKLIAVYNREAVRNKNLTAVTTMEFIEEQLAGITSELREIEATEERYKRENKITELSSDAQQYSVNAESYRNQLSSYTIRLEVLKSIEEFIQSQNSGFQTVLSTMEIQDPTLVSLVNQYNDLQSDRDRMLRTAQPGSPLVKNLDEQILSVKRGLLENLRSIKESIEISRKNFMARANQFDLQSSRVPEIERQLVEITREKITKQEHYNYLIAKREEAALSLAATTVSNSRIIDPAMAGNKPASPNKPLILIFAIFIGFGIPFGYVLAKFKLNDKILSKNDIISKSNLSILGEIFHNRGKEIKVIGDAKKTAMAEHFRLIRTNIQFALPLVNKKVILITSSLPGEGKSFISLNLAISFALTGKKVALCEFDLRKPSMLRNLGLEVDKGISEYIQQPSLEMEDIKINDVSLPDNLTLFGCGKIPTNPSEIMLAPKVIHFLETLKTEFDIILLDTAPVGQVADAYALSRFCDMSIFIMRYNYTPLSSVSFLNDDFKKGKLKNPMILLNDAKDNLNTIYKYGHKYGYYEEDGKVSNKIKTYLTKS